MRTQKKTVKTELTKTQTNFQTPLTNESHCVEWTGKFTRDGYGQTWIGKTNHLTHRLAYIEAYGQIPAGKEISHSCHNRKCCNPDHLEALTHAENIRKINESGRAKKKRVYLKKEVREYIRENEMDIRTDVLCQKYNISFATLNNIKKGK